MDDRNSGVIKSALHTPISSEINFTLHPPVHHHVFDFMAELFAEAHFTTQSAAALSAG